MSRQGWWAIGLLALAFLMIYFTSTAFKDAPLRPTIALFEPIEKADANLTNKIKPPPVASKVFFNLRPLIVYVEKEAIPLIWLEQWKKETGESIEQRIFIPSEGKELPLDGDVYSVSPRYFQKLKEKMELLAFEENEFWNGTNPAFGGQSFDVDNRWTRPWRWSPYFFYLRQATPQTPLPRTDVWWTNTNAFFPRDLDLLVGLRMKEMGSSANALQTQTKENLRRELEKSLSHSLADEKSCWEAIRDGKIEITFLPAAFRLKNQGVTSIAWVAPSKGTLIQFDVLAISSRSLKTDAAKKLIGFLTSPAIQERMISETGYLPTHTRPQEEWKGTSMAAPNGSWFEHSEFLFRIKNSPNP
ncbi:MAG: hypothetical protein ACOY3I_00035 [Verrucomicrobiota bacterium]